MYSFALSESVSRSGVATISGSAGDGHIAGPSAASPDFLVQWLSDPKSSGIGFAPRLGSPRPVLRPYEREATRAQL